MSVRIMGAVWELDLEPRQKLVLLALADHADHNGNNVHPSIDLIAYKTGFSERNVQYVMRELERSGILVAVGERKGGRGRTGHYRIVPENGAKLAPFVREMGEKFAPFSRENGAWFAPFSGERVQDPTLKGATGCTRTVNEPLRRDGVDARAREEPMPATSPSYREVLDGKYEGMRAAFVKLNPALITEEWFDNELAHAQFWVGPLSVQQLAKALRAAHAELKDTFEGETPEHRIRNKPGFARNAIRRRLEEQARCNA